MVWQKHVLFVNAAIRGRYRTHDVILDPHYRYSVVEATSLQQIENSGHPCGAYFARDNGTGLIWRIHGIWRYQERDGGVYLEVELIVLGRDIPARSGGWSTP